VRILLVNTDYPEFLRSLYAENPGLEDLPYAEQSAVRDRDSFGVTRFYVDNLRALGVDAQVVHVNNEPLQRAWAREHGVEQLAELPSTQEASRRRRIAQRLGARRVAPLLRRASPTLGVQQGWVERILAAQVRAIRPDVVLSFDMISLSPPLLRALKRDTRLLVGQHGAVDLPYAPADLRVYDLVVSNFPPTIDRFRDLGIDAEFLQLAFDPRVLDELTDGRQRHDLSFVGSFFPGVHDLRTALVERVCAHFPDAAVWGPSVDMLASDSPIRRAYRGPAWGTAMYQALKDSRLTLNVHGDMVGHAANYRLFEATGVGTLLLTDWKDDLPRLFDPEHEVVTFRDAEECIALAERFLADPAARDARAAAGQARTLREHTYRQRMEELVALLAARLDRSDA
jgi:hypothetical protein